MHRRIRRRRRPQGRTRPLDPHRLVPDARRMSGLRVRDAAAHLVWGSECAGCGAPALTLCPACAVALRPTPRLVDPTVGPGVPTCAARLYAGPTRQTLIDFKEHGRFALAGVLGDVLAASVAAVVPARGPVVLVPVPSSRASVRRRGFDAVDLLARRAARRLRRDGRAATVRHVLRHVRRVADQAGLDAHHRMLNLEGALAVSARPPRGRVVVVDDIVTTGATAAEAVRAITSRGGSVTAIGVVAATPREASPFP